LRGQVPLVLDQYDYQFELGKAKLLREGADVLIISTGLMTMRALEAADCLKSTSVDAAVLHVSTIKPLDEAMIVKEASRRGRMVVVAGKPLDDRRSRRSCCRSIASCRRRPRVPADSFTR
jgi:transketolase